MTTATLAKPVTLTAHFQHPQQPQSRRLDLKREHLHAGLDPDDLQHLEALPSTVIRKGQTFKGISIE